MRSSSSRTRDRAPRGRNELLTWINTTCGAHYASVESLRDGILYTQLLETLIRKNGEAQSIVASHDDALVTACGKATNLASQLLSKVEFAAATKDDFLANTRLLHDMMRRCIVPAKHSLEINEERLADGKLQDHMNYLQWLYAHTQRVQTSIQQSRAGVPQSSTEAETPTTAAKTAAKRGPTKSPAARSRNAAPRTPRASDASMPPRETLQSAVGSSGPATYDPAAYSPRHVEATPAASADDDEDAAIIDDIARDLGSIVGELEVLEDRLSRKLRHDPGAGNTSLDSAGDVTFSEVQEVLAQRDDLWQTLSFVHEATEQHNAKVEATARAGDSAEPPQLLRELNAMFRASEVALD